MDIQTKTNLKNLLESMEDIHFPYSNVHSATNKLYSLLNTNVTEVEAIGTLIESHSAGVRYIATERYQKILETANTNGNLVDFKCNNTYNNKTDAYRKCLSEMPKEWVLVQLTSQYNSKEHIKSDSKKYSTDGLCLTILNCGFDQLSPITITLDAPVDSISGNAIEICQEMYNILQDHDTQLKQFKEKYKTIKHVTAVDRKIYADDRSALNDRLESLINVIQNKWLDTWRCLFLGKFIDNNLEANAVNLVEKQLNEFNYENISEKNKVLLIYLLKGSSYLRLPSLQNGLKYIFPKDEDRNIRFAFNKLFYSKKSDFEEQKRHPIILIIDEALDFIPWEMIDILQNQSVSRVPSLHFAYSLFKEYESNIVNGFLEVSSINKTVYMLNPGLDLIAMQKRMNSFFNYWRPDWSGLVGMVPSEDEFLDLLTNSEIFIYCGHGSGTQFLSGESIQKTKIRSIVFLLGCSSIKLSSTGPQAEICSSYFSYLIASSPCVIGMLWPVTDYETDCLSTELLSHWIPSDVATHWSLVSKEHWAKDGKIKIDKSLKRNRIVYEPELLKALANVKKYPGKYLTKAACTARGLPVKLII